MQAVVVAVVTLLHEAFLLVLVVLAVVDKENIQQVNRQLLEQ
jgi:hypothetical protein